MLPRETTFLKYLKKKGKRRLYQQWVEKANLPPDVISREKVTEDRISKVDRQRSHLYILYILLGVALIALCAGLVLLVVYSS